MYKQLIFIIAVLIVCLNSATSQAACAVGWVPGTPATIEACYNGGYDVEAKLRVAGAVVGRFDSHEYNWLRQEVMIVAPGPVGGFPVRVRIHVAVMNNPNSCSDFCRKGDIRFALARWDPAMRIACLNIINPQVNSPCWREGRWQRFPGNSRL